MPAYALLLRGVNVGGRNKVPMASLRVLVEREGYTDAATLLQSGNAVFRGPGKSAPALETLFETRIASSLSVECDCFVRTAKEWDALLRANPLTADAKRDPAHLLVVFLKSAPAASALTALRAAVKGRETVALAGRQLYAAYPDGIGNSKLTLPVIEKHLGTRGTGRSWNTLLKMAELLGR